VAAWEDTATGHRCNTHQVEFARGEVCRACADERRGALQQKIKQVDGSSLNESIELDTEIARVASEALAFSKMLHRVSKERIDDGNPNDWNAASKLIAEGTKLQRFALEAKEKLSARAHSRYLVEHEKEVRGLRRKGN
jgi:hypothetical protein